MHAVVIHANIHDPAEAKRGLDEQVIPLIKNAPGFVGAYFVALEDGQGVAIEVFETEEQARAAIPARGRAAPGVTLDAVQFGDVIGAV